MSPSVLILTPDPELGKWFEEVLGAPGNFTIAVAAAADLALQFAQQQVFDLLILDTGLDGIPLGELVAALRHRLPELRVSILPPEKENATLPLLGFTPDGYLTRPLNALEALEQARDLTSQPSADNQVLDEVLVELFSEIPPPDPLAAVAPLPQAPARVEAPAASAWTNDPEVIAKVLAYLRMKTGALGAFILVAGRSSWHSDSLSTADRGDIDGWSRETFLDNSLDDPAVPGEMVGFVQLPSSNQDCQVFLAPLEKDNLLGLVFGADVPFRKVRSQVAQLVRTLIESRKASSPQKTASSPPGPPRSLSVVLAPRQQHQKLTGKISASISEWIRQIAASLGWQIVHLAVRPDHVLWISSAPAQTLPENQVSIVRQYTSMRMKQVFPEAMKDNPAGDFWAPESLIRDSAQPPAAQELRQYLQGLRGHGKTASD